MLRIWGPHGKLHATMSVSLAHMSAQLLVRAIMSTFREKVEIEFTQGRFQHGTSFPDFLSWLDGSIL